MGLSASIVLYLDFIFVNKWCQVSIERRKCLRSGPFILKGTEKVYHLIYRRLKMSGRCRLKQSCYSMKSFFQELSQAPSCTIRREHSQIVNMIISISMRIAHFFRIDVGEPVVSSYFFGVFENEPSNRISDVGIFFDSPIYIF